MISRLFKDFFNSEKTGGIVLLVCTILSLIISNSEWRGGYLHFWHSRLDLSFLSIGLNYSILHWINDGLMTLFFLLVGLEIERELFIGELKDIRSALLPIVAALGGMMVPAMIHYLFNAGTATQSGFGIPVATDIAFALGALALLGRRLPFSLKIFLTALAIIDDIGAIIVIAAFYSNGISWIYLLSALGIFGALFLLGRLKVYNLIFYIIPGIVMWYCMLRSGVHATITGVLLAFAIPFGKDSDARPSYRLQHFLHRPVAFIILPLFALANTGLILSPGWGDQLFTRNSAGIICGLVVGKPIGILLFCFILIKMKLGRLPAGVNWSHLLGVGILAGIGFTMSIFIANLAFADNTTIQASKTAILTASAVASMIGLLLLYFSTKRIKGSGSAIGD